VNVKDISELIDELVADLMLADPGDRDRLISKSASMLAGCLRRLTDAADCGFTGVPPGLIKLMKRCPAYFGEAVLRQHLRDLADRN
jgi:hypothetical protein